MECIVSGLSEFNTAIQQDNVSCLVSREKEKFQRHLVVPYADIPTTSPPSRPTTPTHRNQSKTSSSQAKSSSAASSHPTLDFSNHCTCNTSEGDSATDGSWELNAAATNDFSLWMNWLHSRARPNLLFHGLGSKIKFLDVFTQKYLRQSFPAVSVLYAYHHQASFRSFLLDTIVTLSKQLRKSVPLPLPRQLNDLKSVLSDIIAAPKTRQRTPRTGVSDNTIPIRPYYLCMVIHSLDSVLLRNYQDILADLGSHPRIRIVASVDHCRYPLLWNSSQYNKFRFFHINVPTLENYNCEINHNWKYNEQPLWLQNNKNLQPVSFDTVQVALTALAPRVRDLYRLLACMVIIPKKSQSEHLERRLITGTDWPEIKQEELFHQSRKEMIYSDKQKFEAALQELFDHEIVLEIGKGCLVVPVERSNLLELFSDIEKDDITEEEDDEDDDDDEEDYSGPFGKDKSRFRREA